MTWLYAYRGAVLTWLCLPFSIAVFVFSLCGLIAAAYHPESPGIHLVPARIILAGLGMIGCAVLVFRHGVITRREKAWRNAFELVALVAALWSALHLYALVFPQPKMIRLVFQGQIYDIPRVYRPGAFERDGVSTIDISICAKTGEPVYAASCNAWSQVALSNKPIMAGVHASYALDEAGATYARDDVVTDWGAAKRQPDGSYTFDVGSGTARYLSDSDNRIVRFAFCYKVTGGCEVQARIGGNVLRFSARADEDGGADFWRNDETSWLATFDSWKCATACEDPA